MQESPSPSVERHAPSRDTAAPAPIDHAELLESAAELGRFGAWRWDMVQQRLYVSPRLEGLLGYGPGELHGDVGRWLEMVEQPAAGELAALVRRYRESGAAQFRLEVRLRSKAGASVWMESVVRVERSPEGAPLRLTGCAWDVSECKRLEQSLDHNRQFVANIAQAAPFLLHATNLADHRLLYISPRIEQVLGLTPEQAYARGPDFWPATLDPADHPKLAAGMAWAKSAAEGQVMCEESTWRRPDGEKRRMRCRFVVFGRNEAGRPAQLLGFSEDVTAQLALAEQLQQAQHLAAIGTLAAGIAHEVNNPIGAALLSAETALALLPDAGNRPEVERCLRNVIDAARRGGEIVRNVLRFARAEPLERCRTSLRGVAERAVRDTADYAAQRGAAVELRFAGDEPWVEGNALELERMLLNLVRNAVESRSEGARVTVACETEGREVRLSVSDNGRGMTAEQQRRVLEPFFTTRAAEGGSGLGLSLCHATVRDHGGRLLIESRPGAGCRMTVVLPRHPEDAPPAETAGGLAMT